MIFLESGSLFLFLVLQIMLQQAALLSFESRDRWIFDDAILL
jgi:hypothetical protein